LPELIQQCLRCGIVWESVSGRKHKDFCESCRARKVQKIDGCIVWHGHFGADMVTPVDEDGIEVLQGIRNCGKLDCVNPLHIEKENDGKERS
jgi:hypothetical protein